MSNAKGIGAPKGGRVHWLLFNLPQYVKSNYIVSYDYLYHNYLLISKHDRFSNKTFNDSDIFIIVRTSKKCFRVSAHNVTTSESVYKSYKTSQGAADYIGYLAECWQLEREQNQTDNQTKQNKIRKVNKSWR